MNKITGSMFIVMVTYIFGMALYALINHLNIMLRAVIRLDLIASAVFDIAVNIALIVLCVYTCVYICVYIYRRINR